MGKEQVAQFNRRQKCIPVGNRVAQILLLLHCPWKSRDEERKGLKILASCFERYSYWNFMPLRADPQPPILCQLHDFFLLSVSSTIKKIIDGIYCTKNVILAPELLWRGSHPLLSWSKLWWYASGSSFGMNPRPLAIAHLSCSSPMFNLSNQSTWTIMEKAKIVLRIIFGYNK